MKSSVGRRTVGRLWSMVGDNRGVAVLLMVVLVVLALPLFMRSPPGGTSVESRLANGLLGVRRLLEDWNTDVNLAKVSTAEDLKALVGTGDAERARKSGAPAVAFVAFPVQRTLLGVDSDLDDWVRDGGTLVAGYSGVLLSLEEEAFLAQFGVVMSPSIRNKSLSPLRWWRGKRNGEEHFLQFSSLDEATAQAEVAPTDSRTAVSDQLSTMPLLRAGCTGLARPVGDGSSSRTVSTLRTGSGTRADEELDDELDDGEQATRRRTELASVVRCSHDEGQIWLVPTSMLVNGRLAAAGNLELLWHLRQNLGPNWTVLEGTSELLLGAEAEQRARDTRATLNMMALQLGVLYLGAVLALGWGFGPRWAPAQQPPEGHRSFLLGLGALHQKLGGLGAAARLLHERWLDYDPLARRRHRQTPPSDTMTEEELVLFAGDYSRKRNVPSRD